jgi:hypothetical protein
MSSATGKTDAEVKIFNHIKIHEIQKNYMFFTIVSYKLFSLTFYRNRPLIIADVICSIFRTNILL